jgi:four helix bundle protein
MDLAEGCYKTTAVFPRDEIYGLTAQIRRAATSIAANVAEGYGRESTGSFVQFLRISQGSLKELETHLLLAQRIQLSRVEGLALLLDQCERVSKMLRNLIRSLVFRFQQMIPAVILGLVPRIQPSTNAGASGRMDGRDKPDHDNPGYQAKGSQH